MCGELYAVLAARVSMDPETVDATKLWKVGALLHHLARDDAKTEEDEVKEAYAAYKRGEGPDPRLHPADQRAMAGAR